MEITHPRIEPGVLARVASNRVCTVRVFHIEKSFVHPPMNRVLVRYRFDRPV